MKDIVLKETIYETLLANDIPKDDISTHESDLCVRITPHSHNVVKAFFGNKMPESFRSNIEGDDIWFNIPFAYFPL